MGAVGIIRYPLWQCVKRGTGQPAAKFLPCISIVNEMSTFGVLCDDLSRLLEGGRVPLRLLFDMEVLSHHTPLFFLSSPVTLRISSYTDEPRFTLPRCIRSQPAAKIF